MSKGQSDRLSNQQQKGGGPKVIYTIAASFHDNLCKDACIEVKELLIEKYNFEFRHVSRIMKADINEKLKKYGDGFGATLYVADAHVKPDGGVIQVKDQYEVWRTVLVAESKYQGKDVENIIEGKKVGTGEDQDIMTAGNAVERVFKNIAEMKNYMHDEKHFPYVVFFQGSNFLLEDIEVQPKDGSKSPVKLERSKGKINRIDRVTAASFGRKLNQNYCTNTIRNGVMLQSASLYVKTLPYDKDEMLAILMDIAKTSMRVLLQDEQLK